MELEPLAQMMRDAEAYVDTSAPTKEELEKQIDNKIKDRDTLIEILAKLNARFPFLNAWLQTTSRGLYMGMRTIELEKEFLKKTLDAKLEYEKEKVNDSM